MRPTRTERKQHVARIFRAGDGGIFGRGTGAAEIHDFVEFHCRRFPGPQPVDGHIPGQGDQPGHRAIAIGGVAISFLPNSYERVLQCVFGLGSVCQDTQAYAEKFRAGGSVQQAEGVPVAKAGLRYQLFNV